MLTLNLRNTGNAALFWFSPCSSRNSCSSKSITVTWWRWCLVTSVILEGRTPCFLCGSLYVPSGDDLCCISPSVFRAMVEPHACLGSVERCKAFLKWMQGLYPGVWQMLESCYSKQWSVPLFVELNRKSWNRRRRLLCQPVQWDIAAGQGFWLASFRVFLQYLQEDQTWSVMTSKYELMDQAQTTSSSRKTSP